MYTYTVHTTDSNTIHASRYTVLRTAGRGCIQLFFACQIRLNQRHCRRVFYFNFQMNYNCRFFFKNDSHKIFTMINQHRNNCTEYLLVFNENYIFKSTYTHEKYFFSNVIEFVSRKYIQYIFLIAKLSKTMCLNKIFSIIHIYNI